MTLTSWIANKKEELAKILDRKVTLENEIADLECQLASVKINNPDACLNPDLLINDGCNLCYFRDGCSYRFKGQGKRFKL